ncbi:unnamed protein product [Bubo scandiacus]
MATRGGRYPRGAGMEAAAEPRGRPTVQDDLRRLRGRLEARQRHLRARIAACEQLTAEMAALRAALGAGGSSGPGPAPPSSLTRQAPGTAGGSSGPGGGGNAKP